MDTIRHRHAALRAFAPFLEHRRGDVLRAFEDWHQFRVHAATNPRTRQPLVASTLAADIRHLDAALRRQPRPFVLLANIHVRDVYNMWLGLSARRIPVSATPMPPERMMSLLHYSLFYRPRATRPLFILMCAGAARHRELQQPFSFIRLDREHFTIFVFPKGGRMLKLATIPRTVATLRFLGMSAQQQALRGPLSVLSLQQINQVIADATVFFGWTEHYTTYSLRHGSIADACQRASAEEIIQQTGHARALPLSYRRHCNPQQRLQLAVLGPIPPPPPQSALTGPTPAQAPPITSPRSASHPPVAVQRRKLTPASLVPV